MESQTLRPQRQAVEIKGKLSYSEHIHGWNTIRFKKELVKEFPQLKEKTSAFGYKMIIFQDYGLLEKSIRRFKRTGEAVPILMWLVKEKK